MRRQFVFPLAVVVTALVAASAVLPSESSAQGGRCNADFDCDDGVFCNGKELCRVGAPGADVRGCVKPTAPACATPSPSGELITCNEALRRCEGECARHPDKDGDGHRDIKCGGGDDCDDTDPNRHPGLREVCDPAGHDEDCDPSTVGFKDDDRDGFTDAMCRNELDYGVSQMRTSPLPVVPGMGKHVIYAPTGVDCDDNDARVGPNTQICLPNGHVRICAPLPMVPGHGVRPPFAWKEATCPTGQTCVTQPNGAGVCMR